MFMWDERKDAIRSYNHQDTLAIENEIAKVSNQPPVQPTPSTLRKCVRLYGPLRGSVTSDFNRS